MLALELLFILVVVYLLECAVWVPPQATGVRRRLFGGARLLRARQPTARYQRAVLWGQVWPPLFSAIPTERLPFAVTVERLTLIDGRELDRAAAARASAEGTRLRVGRAQLVLCSRRLAGRCAAFLRRWAGADQSARVEAIGELLDARFDLAETRQAFAEHRRRSWALRTIACVQLLLLFAGAYLLIATRWRVYWLPVLAALGALWVLIFVLFAFARRSLAAALRPDWSYLLLVGLSPISALRAHDLLARESISDRHPLTAALALGASSQAIAEPARRFLVDAHLLRHAASETLRTWGATLAERISELVGRHGLDVERLLEPPERETESVIGYCPRCLSQYQSGQWCSELACNETYLLPLDVRVDQTSPVVPG
ncbi:MAG: hypothetical protein H6707_21545 [Deltaproteobacteria bacterium]|nr:hypothetical protein [Deltaproteobacteria bacterium]